MLQHPTTAYFRHVRGRPDRVIIYEEWISRTIGSPDWEEVQHDGRIRRWKRIAEADGRALRVILLADGRTVHNAFLIALFGEPSDEDQVF